MSYKYLILGLLSDQQLTGYDIRKRVKATLNTIVSASYGTLYPTLHKLLAAGAVEVQEVHQQSRPSKKLYSITDLGRSDLESWLRQRTPADRIQRDFLLKLYLSEGMTKQEILALLAWRRGETAITLEILRGEKRKTTNVQHGWVIDFSIALYEAELEWVERFVAQLESA
jgi:DNA-binding PadR family transcriptional regulator